MSLFSFKNFNISLNKETKSLNVSIHSSERKTYLDQDLLVEILTLFDWLSQHVEVETVVFESKSVRFNEGLNQKNAEFYSKQEIEKIFTTLEQVVFCSLHLPQVIIIDLGMGCAGVGSELSLIGDFRVGHEMCHVHFDHLSKGYSPSCGGVSLLSEVVGPMITRNWTLSGRPIGSNELKASGFLMDSYQNNHERDALLSELKKRIHRQSSVSRLQTKRALLEVIASKIEKTSEINRTISYASLFAYDWQRVESDTPFMKISEFKKKLKDFSETRNKTTV